ncbi:SLAIN motif-containing protein 2-like isoform X2 [Periplaneta americana]|uniref:SLAIN motif-containing protein 2-like isoform X2 n=1 Tax=Periplaneta americana TaxID=6978 RepID=UPI0037E7EAF5
MDNKTDDVDPRDEVRKLQDKVRKLEFQNEQLRSQHTRNGLIGNKMLTSVSNENYLVQTDQVQTVDEYDILKINSEDFVDEERWLYIPQNSTGRNVPDNLEKWLRQDIDNNNDYEFQLMRRKLIQELDEIEQGLRRNNIDTRTFTRSKKRMTRPSLETMVESPLYENRRKNPSPWRTSHLQHTEDIDDISLQLNTSLNSTFGPLASESLLHNFNMSSNEMVQFNSLLQKIASDPHLNLTPELKNNTFQKTASDPDELNIFQKLSEPDMNTTFLKVSDPCLPVNRQKSVDMNTTFQLTPKSRSITPSGLNCTFSIQDGSSSSSNRSGRTMSCDSGGDDDQLSSASDSSFSSSNRLMNVGDVQNIARLQEESLKQVMSTPKNNKKREGVIHGSEEDLPSPILKDLNHGYQSDHSDHSSSADGRARSSRSSLKSSPGGSPFGSTQILTNDSGEIRGNNAGRPWSRFVRSEAANREVTRRQCGNSQSTYTRKGK